MAIKEKPIWTFRTLARQETRTKSRAWSRDVEMVIDEPIERGGTNEGPMPVEMVFAGLAGCTHVISNKLAKANDVVIEDMEIDIVTTMDSHGTRLIKPIDVPFPKVIINITATMSGHPENISEIVTKLKEHCALAMMLRQSGSEVIEHWTINGAIWNEAA
ncbi:OsmC family protein [Silicimonas sp. MF1-12-2]|uniref:OsmC family protein n=1 Tax=Silicimonas sp. MF1-12-2 TaxID=3384793 RepID=UPI0039B62870